MNPMKPGEYEQRRREIAEKITAAEVDFRAAALAVETGAGSKEDRTAARVRLDELKDDLVSLSAANELSSNVAIVQERVRIAAEWEAFREAFGALDAERVAKGKAANELLAQFLVAYGEFSKLGQQQLGLLQPLTRRLRDPRHFVEFRDSLTGGGVAVGRALATVLFHAGIDVSGIDRNIANFGFPFSRSLEEILSCECEIDLFAPRTEDA